MSKMQTVNNKNVSICGLDEYIKSISTKMEKHGRMKQKIDDENVIIPTMESCDDLLKYNYNLSQLKSFAKHYKLKISGNKNELFNRIYSYLYLSKYAIKIEKVFRGMLQRKYDNFHGPAAKNRKLCTNSCDFVTMEPLEEINFHQFFSYKDTDGFIYGFDIISLYNLLFKNENDVKNPYNRSNIPDTVFINVKALLRLSKMLKINVKLNMEDDTIGLSNEKTIQLRTLSLFQNIDALGNYSNPDWFLSLDKPSIIIYLRELIDIWNYRAQLGMETKRAICHPSGDPFRNLSMQYIQSELDMNNVRKVVLEVMEKMVTTGIDKDSKCLGAYYVLGGLTIVNENAAISLPWLYQTMSYF
jgi:hypothetical protein